MYRSCVPGRRVDRRAEHASADRKPPEARPLRLHATTTTNPYFPNYMTLFFKLASQTQDVQGNAKVFQRRVAFPTEY